MKNILQFALGLVLSVTALHAHSDAFTPKFVDTLVEPYLAIEQGLAGDDLTAAQSAAATFLEAMKSAPQTGEASEEAADLSEPATSISGAVDLDAARAAFLDLSRQMILLVKHVGVTGETSLYKVHCPMAFNHKGGSWMQAGMTVMNPYYGSMMLHCGGVKEQIAGHKMHSEDDGHGHGEMHGHSVDEH